MREFVVTAEERDEAADDPVLQRIIADRMEREGFVFVSKQPHKFADPIEVTTRPDGCVFYRQHVLQ